MGRILNELTSTAPAEKVLLAIVKPIILDGVLRGAGRTGWHYSSTTGFPVTLTNPSLPLVDLPRAGHSRRCEAPIQGSVAR